MKLLIINNSEELLPQDIMNALHSIDGVNTLDISNTSDSSCDICISQTNIKEYEGKVVEIYSHEDMMHKITKDLRYFINILVWRKELWCI